MVKTAPQTFLVSLAVIFCLILAVAQLASAQGGKVEREQRARDLGVPFEGTPGALDSITDVKGVEVGYAAPIRSSPRSPCVLRMIMHLVSTLGYGTRLWITLRDGRAHYKRIR
jgi:hypothetical protein